jgi:predicted transcriptional regulator
MVALVRPRALDFADALPDGARSAIKLLLATEPKATRKVYAALARKVWSLLIERRFDDEIRDWHSLLHGVKAHVREGDDAAAERLTALADLLRESISLAESSPAREVASRPRARRILELLQREAGFVPRRVLMASLGMTSSHLSNVLTKLVAHNLVDRQEKGKEAEFRITALGSQLLTKSTQMPGAITPQPAVANDDLFERLKSVPVYDPTLVGTIEIHDFTPTFMTDSTGYGPLDVGHFFESRDRIARATRTSAPGMVPLRSRAERRMSAG